MLVCMKHPSSSSSRLLDLTFRHQQTPVTQLGKEWMDGQIICFGECSAKNCPSPLSLKHYSCRHLLTQYYCGVTLLSTQTYALCRQVSF